MKKILFVVAAILGLAFVSPDGARAGGPRVSVSFRVPLPVVVVPSRGYYYEAAPVYYEYDEYAPRRYYHRPVRTVYRGRVVRSGYRDYYRGGRYCD